MRAPRFDPRAGARRSSAATILIGGSVMVALIAFVVIGLRAPDAIPGRSYYNVTVGLKDANTLAPHSDVRVGGARVGQTLAPRIANGHPVVDLQLDSKVRPILTDATVRIRPKSAIGQPYVDLFPGRTGNAIPDDGRLPATRSSTAVPLDKVLDAFDPPTRRRFQTLITQLGTAVAGRGAGGRQSVIDGPAMLRGTAAVTKRLAAEPDALPGFVRNSAGLADTFAGVRVPFARLFKPSAAGLAAIDRERGALVRTLQEAPGTFAQVTAGLDQVTPALSQLRQFATTATPALRLAPTALRQTAALLRAAPGSVPQVNRTLHLADDAVPPTLTLLGSARKAAPALDGIMAAADPMVRQLAPRRCDIVRLARNWENMFAFGDPGGQGGTGLDLTITAAGLSSIGGFSALQNAPDPLLPRSLYPAPCQSYYNARLAGSHGG